MASSTSVTKFILKDKNVYVKLLWKENENDLFHIKIYDGENTWFGRFSHDFAEKYRERVGEDEEEYRLNVMNCLTGKSDMYSFDFNSVAGDTVSATFSWKKRFEGSTVTLVHGMVPVHLENSADSKDLLIDVLLSENRDLRQRIEEFTKKNDILNAELNTCKSELEKFVNIKTSLESCLYGKFVQLLNAKKRRIQLLEDNLQKFEETTGVDSELD